MRKTSLTVLAALALGIPAAGAGAPRIREAARARILPDLSSEQARRLRVIGRAFIAEVREAHGPVLRPAARGFLATAREILTEDQRAKARAAIARLRALPPGQKLALGRRLLASSDAPALRADLAAWIDSRGAASRSAAGERIAWRVAGIIGRRAGVELELDDAQMRSLRQALAKFLDDTRAARIEIHRIGEAKVKEALSILSSEQTSRLGELKSALLDRLRPPE